MMIKSLWHLTRYQKVARYMSRLWWDEHYKAWKQKHKIKKVISSNLGDCSCKSFDLLTECHQQYV